jgi:uncharacterized protein YchJ
MNTSTGALVPWEDVEKRKPAERAQYVEVKRDLTLKEKFDQHIKLYSPCGCGSGKKFRFCCYHKAA